MESTSIGLDIGSSAVRAAEIHVRRDGRRQTDPAVKTLLRYAQVGLPAGAVVDGEVINGRVVSEALRRLWTEGGFSSNKVILGVSGHRVIVRQADVPALDEEDLRSALRFDAQELIPIPMEEASFDFSILDRGVGSDEDGKSTMRILIVAAHRDLLRAHLSALRGAGLEAIAIDATPLSLMRVIPPGGSTAPTATRTPRGEGGPDITTGVEALVAIGAEMTTVAVRQNGVPRFIRSLAVGGSKLTAGIANAMHVEPAVAERLKRGAVPIASPQLVQARRAATTELRDLAEEVRATVDFFVAQSDGTTIERLLLTGGAAQTEGLVETLAGGLNVDIQLIDPFGDLLLDDIGLDEEQLQVARAAAATAVGLALWPAEPERSRLSVLPDEVAATRRARRLMGMTAAGLAVMAAVLAVTGVGRMLAVHDARSQVRAAQQHVTSLKTEVASLQAATAVDQKVQNRADLIVTALSGDIDWVRVLGQLASVMPTQVSLGSFTGTRTLAAAGTTTTGSTGVGTLSFTVTGTGGLPTVAAWLQGLQRDPDIQGTWVSGITLSGNSGSVRFSSTTNLTPIAGSSRAQEVQP